MIEVKTPQNVNISYDPAGLGLRILAYILDGIFFGILALCLGFLILFIIALVGGEGNELFEHPVSIGIYVVLFLFISSYHLIFEYFFNGKSPGKRILGVGVISLDGKKLSFKVCLLRWLFRMIDIQITSGMGAVFTILLTEKQQRIGGLLSNTSVVKIKNKIHFENTVGEILEDDYKIVFEEVEYLDDEIITLIKEVVLFIEKSGNVEKSNEFIDKVYDKTINIFKENNTEFEIKKNYNKLDFLKTIIKDYNKCFNKY